MGQRLPPSFAAQPVVLKSKGIVMEAFIRFTNRRISIKIWLDEFPISANGLATFGNIYIGYTSNLINRFHSHNELSKKDWTRNFRPWMVIYCEYFYDWC